jgi:hypothetical protein
MEERVTASRISSTIQQPVELAVEAQKHLEATVEAAHQILASINEELCNPSLWTTAINPNNNNNSHAALDASIATAPTSTPPPSREQEVGGGALEEARFRYKTAVTSLRAVISVISAASQQSKPQEGDVSMAIECREEQDEIQKLEQRATELREEARKKNHYFKVLIDQLRDLINDITMWQSPVL